MCIRDRNTAAPDKVKLYDIYGKEIKKTLDSKGNLKLQIGISPIYIDGVGPDVKCSPKMLPKK